jgi:peptide/nickel transport system permease protein
MMLRLSLILGLVILIVAFAPLITSTDPMKTNPQIQFRPPSRENLLGTDSLGRDVLSRLLYGGRQTLSTAATALVIALVPGVVLGLVAGSEQGWLDQIIIVFINVLLSIPGLMIALLILTLLGRGILPLAVAIGISQIAPCASVVRSAVMAIRSSTYIAAGYGLGANRWYILIRYILPNIQSTLWAYAGVIFSYSILNSAALSFLGLGSELGVPEWGRMLAEGRAALHLAPWIGLAPGLAITLTVWAVNRIADEVGGQN